MPLRLRDETIGALNLLSTDAEPLTQPDLEVAQALADVATIAILQTRYIKRSDDVTAQLQVALNSRITIEQAKGVLAERSGLSIDRAFNLIRRYARNHQMALTDTAAGIVNGAIYPDIEDD